MSAIDFDQPKRYQSEDAFQRYEFAKRITEIIIHNHIDKSLIIGLYGKWGEGKTSAMNFVKKELPTETIVINFNPWLFTDQEALLKAFFREIAQTLNRSIVSTRENLGKLLAQYAGMIDDFTKLAGFSVSGFAKVGEKMSNVDMETIKSRIDAIITESNKRIVVFIDDIDRLDVKEIQFVFKLVKLTADFSSSTYVLAFDDEMVADALNPVYGGSSGKSGNQFLEKIIQIPIRLPKATRSALRTYTYGLIDKVFRELRIEISDYELKRYRNAFEESCMPVVINPRQSIRYANALFFALPLLSGQTNIVDVLLVEGLKVFFPGAYEFTRRSPSLFLANARQNIPSLSNGRDKEEVKTTLDGFFKTDQTNEQEIKKLWFELFPQFAANLRVQFYEEEAWKRWYRDKRICSSRYFERYFTYSVLKGDISDVEFEEFLNSLGTEIVAEGVKKLNSLIAQSSLNDVLFKLRLWEGELSSTQSESLSSIIAEIVPAFPIEQMPSSAFTPRGESAKIVAQMILNQPTDLRVNQALTVLSFVNEMHFPMEIADALFYKNNNADEKQLSEDDELKIKNYLIGRFRFFYDGNNMFSLLPDFELVRLLLWWHSAAPAEVSELLTKEVAKGSSNTMCLITAFAPTITSFGMPTEYYKGGFTRREYQALTSIIDPAIIYGVLKQDNSIKPTNVALEIISDQTRFSDEERAGIFIQFYEKELEDGQV